MEMALDDNGGATRWWEVEDLLKYNYLFSLIKRIDEDDLGRRSTNLRCARLYGNNVFASLTPTGYHSKYVGNDISQKKITLNVSANMTDTVSSKMTKIKPKVAFLTQNGDYKQQKKAKDLQKFVDGQFYLHNYYEMTNKRVKDSLVFDIGITKIAANGAEIIVERVLPDEIKVDAEDAMYGTPSHLYHVKHYRRSKLIQMFPKFKAQIKTASSDVDTPYRGTWESASNDFVLVVEGWHISSGPDADDGQHIIAISNATLLTESYDKPGFPFIFTRWSDNLIGFFGQSLVDRLTPIQFEINKILRDIQTSMNLFAIPFIAVEIGSRINRAQLNNNIAHIVDYVNQPPRFETPPVMSQQVFDHLERLIRQAYEVSGVSQLSATSRKPSGLDAAVALREFQDIESERFLTFGASVEQSYVESAKLFIDAAKDVASVNKGYKVNVRGKRFIETIKWVDVELSEDAYEMKLYPKSSLPDTPAGRAQFVMEMFNQGIITKEESVSLLEFPDLEASTSLITAPTEDIYYVISKMIEEGIYMAPEAAQNLQLGIKMVNSAYLRSKNSGVEESILELLRRWVEDANELTKKPEPPAAPPPAPAGLVPGLVSTGGSAPTAPAPAAPEELPPSPMPVG